MSSDAVLYRKIVPADIPALFAVRVATDENCLTRSELTALGITEETVMQKLSASYNGWLCEVAGRVIGFAIGDRATGELWVIAVLPEYVGRGIGSALLGAVEGWLHECGWTRLWLTTDVDITLRAYRFYRNRGWVDDRVEDGVRYMTKLSPACTGP